MDAALILLTRAPAAGRVKTRLTHLTPQGQAAVAAAMIEDAVEGLVQADRGDVIVAADPGPEHPWFQALAARWPVALVAQPPGSLGERLGALSERLGSRRAHLFVGGDCPHLPVSTVRDLVDALHAADVAIAPAEDGGYVAIALRRPCPALFRDIPWSTDEVMARTARAARDAGLRLALLPGSWDVDRPPDLERLRALEPASAAPRTRKSLENPDLYITGAAAVR